MRLFKVSLLLPLEMSKRMKIQTINANAFRCCPLSFKHIHPFHCSLLSCRCSIFNSCLDSSFILWLMIFYQSNSDTEILDNFWCAFACRSTYFLTGQWRANERERKREKRNACRHRYLFYIYLQIKDITSLILCWDEKSNLNTCVTYHHKILEGSAVKKILKREEEARKIKESNREVEIGGKSEIRRVWNQNKNEKSRNGRAIKSTKMYIFKTEYYHQIKKGTTIHYARAPFCLSRSLSIVVARSEWDKNRNNNNNNEMDEDGGRTENQLDSTMDSNLIP